MEGMTDAQMEGRLAQMEQRMAAMAMELEANRATRPAMPKPTKPGTFTGLKREDLMNWLHKAEIYLAAVGILETTQAVLIGSSYLEGPALSWWRWYLNEANQGRLPQLLTWNLFKQNLIEKFKPLNAERIAWEKLQSLQQRGSVVDYTNRFQLISIDIPDMSERDKMYRYLTGLKPDIRLHVEMQHPTTLNEAMSFAQTADATMFMVRRGARFDATRPTMAAGPVPMELGALTASERENLMRQGKCFRCRRSGHLARDCPQKIRKTHLNVMDEDVLGTDEEKND